MKTFCLEDVDKQQLDWPWGKLTPNNSMFPNVDLHKNRYTLGRNKDCDCVVPLASVSGLHFTIERAIADEQQQQAGDVEDTFWLTDHSSNGTFIGGQKVGRGNRVQISNRTEIVIMPGRREAGQPKISYYFFTFKAHSPEEAAPEKQVTFVFTDVESSTKLWEAFPKKMNDALIAHDDILRAKLRECKGYEVKTEGDAFMVTFTNVVDAMKWCLGVQEALLNHKWDPAFLEHPSTRVELDPQTQKPMFAGLRIRMGVHVGEPNCRRNPITRRMDYFGPVVNESARVSDSAHGGQVICTETVIQEYEKLVKEGGASIDNLKYNKLGDFPYKGIKNRLMIFRLNSPTIENRQFGNLRVENK